LAPTPSRKIGTELGLLLNFRKASFFITKPENDQKKSKLSPSLPPYLYFRSCKVYKYENMWHVS
jgi:hypothetical protein